MSEILVGALAVVAGSYLGTLTPWVFGASCRAWTNACMYRSAKYSRSQLFWRFLRRELVERSK